MDRDRLLIFISVLMILCAFVFEAWNEAHATDDKVFVLCYHSFLGNKHFAGDVSIQELGRQMDFLRTKGFHFVSYQDLVKGTLRGTRNVLIIIDDGNTSVYRAYHEILKPRHIKPMLAIYPAVIQKKSYALTWGQLGELSRDGCDVAAHGYYHLLLDKALYDKDKAAFNKEIYGSKEALEKRLDRKIQAFVYPNGVRSEVTKKTLKEAGYACAFTITWGPVSSPLRLNKDPYELCRYMIYKGNWGMVSSSILKASGG